VIMAKIIVKTMRFVRVLQIETVQRLTYPNK
jgi:hypothetical protein